MIVVWVSATVWATYTAKLQNLRIHSPSVSYTISTGTLAIKTAAFLTLCSLLLATFHVYLCFLQKVKVNFFFPPPAPSN